MAAERKVRIREKDPGPPDYSPEGIRKIVETDSIANELYTIWFDFEGRSQTPETALERKQRLTDWQLSLTPKKDQFFHDPVTTVEVERREEEVGLGYMIRKLATEDARRLRSAERAAQIEAERKVLEERRKSKSQKLHIRRMKAQERRGTNPQDIH